MLCHVIQDSELIGSIPLDDLSVRDVSEVCECDITEYGTIEYTVFSICTNFQEM